MSFHFTTIHSSLERALTDGMLAIILLKIFNASSERPLSKLSENHKINVIGPSELKLWPFKDAQYKLCVSMCDNRALC